MPDPSSADRALLELLRAVLRVRDPAPLSLYAEVCRQSVTSGRRAAELVALSLKISPRGFFSNRYDAPLFWRPTAPAQILDAARRAAPTAALDAALSEPDSPVARWISDQGRHFTYLAVEHDSRVFKIYLFDTRGGPALPEVDLDLPPEALRQAAYIRCLELNMDQPARSDDTIYFKLETSFEQALTPDFSFHPRLRRPLLDLPGREAVVARLQTLIEGRRRPNAPVLKLRVPATWAPEDLATVPLALSQNVAEPARPLEVNAVADDLRAIGAALGQGEATARWLDTVAPFAAFISYLAAGDDHVTVYYKVGAVGGPWGETP